MPKSVTANKTTWTGYLEKYTLLFVILGFLVLCEANGSVHYYDFVLRHFMPILTNVEISESYYFWVLLANEER